MDRRPVAQNEIGALIRVVEQQNALIKEQVEQQKIENSKERSDRAIGRLRDKAEKTITRKVQDRYRPIVLTSGAFAALGVFVVAVGDPLARAIEVVSGIESTFVSAISALVGAIGAISALFAFFLEERAKRARVLVLTEEAFERFVSGNEFYDKLRYDHDSEDYLRKIISVREISEALHVFESKLDLEVCDEVARVIAERLVNRRLAEFSETPSISPTLILNPEFADEVSTQHYLRSRQKENFGDDSEELPF